MRRPLAERVVQVVIDELSNVLPGFDGLWYGVDYHDVTALREERHEKLVKAVEACVGQPLPSDPMVRLLEVVGEMVNAGSSRDAERLQVDLMEAYEAVGGKVDNPL